MSYETPECFGKYWDPNEPECAGGRDPNKVDANGSHIRERCAFFTSCGARTNARKQEESRRNLIPETSLFRKVEDIARPKPSFTIPEPQQMSQVAVEVQQLRVQLEQQDRIIKQQQQALLHRPTYSTPQAMSGQMMYAPNRPIEMMAMEMSVPKYLTVPEPNRSGEPLWGSLGRMVVRSILKAVGHTVANFADHTPLDRDDIYKDKTG